VEQQYRPERFEDEVYYEATGQGGDVEVGPGTGVPLSRVAVEETASEEDPAPKRDLRRPKRNRPQ
jgi:hypothetical protein